MSQKQKGFFAPKGSGIRRFQQIGIGLIVLSAIISATGTIDAVEWFFEKIVSPVLGVILLIVLLRWLFK